MKHLLLIVVLLCPAFALAQSSDEPEFPRFELSGGYGFAAYSDEIGDMDGWLVSGTANITEYAGIAVQGSGVYGKNNNLFDLKANQYSFLSGPEFAYRTKHVKPFAHFMVGSSRTGIDVSIFGEDLSDSSTNFTVAYGGGVDIGGSKRIAGRFQIDRISFRYFGEWYYAWRFAPGIVIKF
jgi:opacity protein-like surface antigen